MITTHEFKRGKQEDSCDHKRGAFFCGQPASLHKRPKKDRVEKKNN